MNDFMNEKICLFRSMERANEHLKCLALSGKSIGVTCTTPTNFICDLGKLTNQNQNIVDDLTRRAFMLCAISSTKLARDDDYFESCGVLSFLCSLAKIAAGTGKIEAANEQIEQMDQYNLTRETIALSIIANYYSMLRAHDLIEVGSIARGVLDVIDFKFDIELVDEVDCLPVIKDCISTLSEKPLDFSNNGEIDFKGEISKKNVSLFSLAGTTAALPALHDCIASHLGNHCLVASDDPILTFQLLHPLFESSKTSVKFEVDAQCAIKDTFVGRFFIDAFDFQAGDDDGRRCLCDMVKNPLCEISMFSSLSLEECHRLLD